MTGNNGYDPTSLEAWRAHSTIDVPVTEHLSIRVRMTDLLSLLTADDHNPLLDIIVSMTRGGGGSSSLMDDPANMLALSQHLNKLLAGVIVSPPLVEAGHKDGISIVHIPLAHKMAVFMALVGGGEEFEQVERFPTPEKPGVEPGKTG